MAPTYLADQFTTITAPWWFVAAIAGGSSIFGLVVGNLVALWSSDLSDGRKERRASAQLDRENRTAEQKEMGKYASHFLVEAREYLTLTKTNMNLTTNFSLNRPLLVQPSIKRYNP